MLGAAAVWALWCLFLPLYRLSHFILLTALSAGVFAGLTWAVRRGFIERLIPSAVAGEELPEPEPESTGDAELDRLLAQGREAVRELRRLSGSIAEPSVRGKVAELAELTEKIFADIREDPKDAPQIRRFASYYLPTTMKLLNAYERMGSTGVSGGNVSATLRRIEDILDTTVEAYRKQYDALFANEALDIDTDITVMEAMLKREGLSGKDF